MAGPDTTWKFLLLIYTVKIESSNPPQVLSDSSKHATPCGVEGKIPVWKRNLPLALPRFIAKSHAARVTHPVIFYEWRYNIIIIPSGFDLAGIRCCFKWDGLKQYWIEFVASSWTMYYLPLQTDLLHLMTFLTNSNLGRWLLVHPASILQCGCHSSPFPFFFTFWRRMRLTDHLFWVYNALNCKIERAASVGIPLAGLCRVRIPLIAIF